MPSSKHSPTPVLGDPGTRDLDAVEDPGELLPGITLALTAAPVEPFKCTVYSPIEKAMQRAGVPSHALVVGVAP
jgi:hypothetical protein